MHITVIEERDDAQGNVVSGVVMREIDVSTRRISSSTPMVTPYVPKKTIKRKKRRLSRRTGPKIVRIGRYYTNADCATLPFDQIPHALRFNTARAAKRFFSKPIRINSAKQMTAIFGKPSAHYHGLLALEDADVLHVVRADTGERVEPDLDED